MNHQLLHIQGLSKTYAKNDHPFTLNNINLEIKKGEIISLVGPSGSGKSTLLKLIYGVMDADDGRVHFNGKRVWGPAEQLIPGAKGMQFVQQDYNLNPYAKVYDNIAPVLPNTDLEYKRERIQEVMDLLNISELKDQAAIRLSGGQQQRVAIARALAGKPDLLLLDEPFSNLDVILKHHLKRDLSALVEKTGISLLIVTHDSAEALSLSNRILVMKNGEIIQDDTPKQIYTQPNSIEVAKLFGTVNVMNSADFNLIFGTEVEVGMKVLIRPHQLSLSSSGHIPCLIHNVEYHGSFDLYIVELPGQSKKLQIHSSHIGRFNKGDRAYLSLIDAYSVISET